MALPQPVTSWFFGVDGQFASGRDFSPGSLRTGLVSAFLELAVAQGTAVKTQSPAQGDSQKGGRGLTGHRSSGDPVLGMGGARWTFVTRVGRGSPRSQPGPRAPGGRCSLSGARTGSSFLLAAPRGGLRPPWASASLSVRERTGRDGRASCFRHTFRNAGRVGPRGLLPRGAGLPAGTEQAGTGAADPRARSLSQCAGAGVAGENPCNRDRGGNESHRAWRPGQMLANAVPRGHTRANEELIDPPTQCAISFRSLPNE